MSEPRLKAGIWISMALRLGDRQGRPGVILRKGDSDAGGILVLLRGRDGIIVLSRVSDPNGGTAWMRGTGATPVDQAAADAYLARRLRVDPDLWVVEFETPDLSPPFEAKIV